MDGLVSFLHSEQKPYALSRSTCASAGDTARHRAHTRTFSVASFDSLSVGVPGIGIAKMIEVGPFFCILRSLERSENSMLLHIQERAVQQVKLFVEPKPIPLKPHDDIPNLVKSASVNDVTRAVHPLGSALLHIVGLLV
jgi:hypothetical protein